MVKEFQVAAFENGAIRILASEDAGREAVLALPLNRLLVRMVRVPADQDAVAFSLPLLQAMSPFPDESLTVSCETVRTAEESSEVIAAALPESATEDIAEALDAAKLNIVRIDALELGALRLLWSDIVGTDEACVRRLVMMEGQGYVSLIVLDGDRPSVIRSITDFQELRREIMLSLLEAEDFGGALALKEIVWVKMPKAAAEQTDGESPENEGAAPVPEIDEQMLSAFASVRRVDVADADSALKGVAERTLEAGTLDVSPESWRDVLQESRFKRKLIKYLSIAGGIWLLIMGVLFGVPFVYDRMADYQKGLSRDHRRQYEAVRTMKGKVDLVRKYSNHDRGALEVMREISAHLPEGIELGSWTFRREDGVRVSGEADAAQDVYDFKDNMIGLGGDDPVFKSVVLNGPSAGRGGRQKFDVECRFEGEEEE